MKPLNKEIYTRLNIMEGSLELPSYQSFVTAIGPRMTEIADRMFKAMWRAYLKDKGSINLPYWSEKFDNAEVFNIVLMSLADAGWIESHSIPARNWAEASIREEKLLTIVTVDELASVRANYKLKQYIMEDTESTYTNKTKLNGKVSDTGLIRKGFQLAGNTRFQFDTNYMEQYYDVIKQNLTKSMDKIGAMYPNLRKDKASYDTISVDILEYHLNHDNEVYSRGNNINDSRGRAISQGLKKVFNPISNKDARSLLVIPEEYRVVATTKGRNAIYLFIAELLGSKATTKFQKSCFGKQAYINKTLHEFDFDNEKDRADVHENIWLERLYDDLDAYSEAIDNGKDHKWSTPIELDASASMLQYEGILLGHKPFCEMTNLTGDTLSDPWAFDGIPRKQFKEAMTPMLYGSSQPCHVLWKNRKHDYTPEQVQIFNNEISTGKLAVADKFKEFVIKCCKPQEHMTVKVWNEEFKISCNRWKNVGDETRYYDIYDSDSKTIKTIHHTHTHKEADLEQFRRYFVTLLIHNLDSQTGDYVCQEVYEEFEWIIDIHDAFIVNPEAADLTRKAYARKMNAIYVNRKKILADYFDSIGITGADDAQWKEVLAVVDALTEFECNDMALK